MSTDVSMRSIRGAELESYVCDPEVQLAFAAKLAPGGSEDISQRIRAFYKVPKNFPASYIARFVQLAKLTGDARDSISILAPHTHWHYDRPIIYKYNAAHNRYVVGLHSVQAEDLYRPVSFIVHNGRIFAYEWLDVSVVLCDSIWQKAVPKIHSILGYSVSND